MKEGSRLPRSKGYKKQEALDGGYLNVRLSADLSAKLDRDCADYARRAGKPDASRVRGSYVRELISAGLQGAADADLESASRAMKSVAWELEAASIGASPAPTAEALQGWSDRLMEASLMLDRAAGER